MIKVQHGKQRYMLAHLRMLKYIFHLLSILLLYRAQDVLDLLLNCQELLGITLTLIPSLSRSTGFVVNDFSQIMPK